jgi:hypothetical protein
MNFIWQSIALLVASKKYVFRAALTGGRNESRLLQTSKLTKYEERIS